MIDFAERQRQVFAERARQLAARSVERRSSGAAHLVVGIDKQFFGIELSRVTELFPLRRWTPVPGAAAEVLGVVFRGGEILSVIDLATVLEVERKSSSTSGYAVTLGRGAALVVRVDRVVEVRSLEPTAEGRLSDSLITGFTESSIAVLDTDTLIARYCPQKSRPDLPALSRS